MSEFFTFMLVCHRQQTVLIRESGTGLKLAANFPLSKTAVETPGDASPSQRLQPPGRYGERFRECQFLITNEDDNENKTF
jgi:hypothetical protein